MIESFTSPEIGIYFVSIFCDRKFAQIPLKRGKFCLDPGHLDFLEAARKEGDYLMVGLHSDSVKINIEK